MLYVADQTLSGKAGAKVFSKNGRVRQYKLPTNPNTPAQAQARSQFGENSTTYGLLTPEKQLLWKDGAASYPRVNRVGQTYTMSASAFYASVNQNIQRLKEQLGDDNAEDKLQVPGPVKSPAYFTLKEQIGENEEDGLLVKSVGTAGAMEADISYVWCYASSPQSSGRTFVASSQLKPITVFNKAAVAAAATGDAGFDIEAAYVAKFGALPQAGSRVFVEFWGIEKDEGVLRLVGKQMLVIVPVTP